MKILLPQNTRKFLLPSVLVLLVSFLVYTFVYPWILYKLYYPEDVQAVSAVDFSFIEQEVGDIGIAINDETEVVKMNLGGKLLQIEKDLSSLSFSGRILRLVDGSGKGLMGFQYDGKKKGRDSIHFTTQDGLDIEFKFYDDLFIIRTNRSILGALQVSNAHVNTQDGRISVGNIVNVNQSGSTQKESFAPIYQIGGIYVDGVSVSQKTSRDTEIARVFQRAGAATQSYGFPTKPSTNSSLSLVDNYARLGALSFTIPDGTKQEIRIVHSFDRSIGSESYISSDTFQGDQNAVDEILKMGGLDFIKKNTFFYNDSAKIGYLDYGMKKFVELKLKSEQPQYIGKRGEEIIYQGKEDTYVYTLKPNEQAKIKENVYITKKRVKNTYTYEILGNYQLEKHADGSIALLGQNLNKAGLSETCSDDYYDKEQKKRLSDIQKLPTATLLKKYGKTSTGEIDTTEFCISPKILSEKKKAVPYDVPVFHLEKPVVFDRNGAEVFVSIDVGVADREITYSFDSSQLDDALFPIKFDPTLTTDAELQDADHSNMRISGGTGLGTEPSGGPLGEWESTTSLISSRSDHGVVVYDGYIYAIGGNVGGSTSNSVHYAPINSNGTLGAWATTTSLSNARVAHGVIAYNGYIYAMGGTNGTAMSSVEYAPINSNGTLGAWATTTSLSNARYLFGSAVYNGYIYILGGVATVSVQYISVNANGTLGSWTTTSSLPANRSDPGVVLYNGYIYALGGKNSVNELSTVVYSQINSNGTLGLWYSTTSMSIPREGFGTAVYNGFIYALGGRTTGGSTIYDRTVEYTSVNSNGTLNAWISTASMITGRTANSHAVTAYNGYIYAVGGYNSVGGNSTTSVEYARIQTIGGIGKWTAGTNMCGGITKSMHGVVSYNGYIYAVGGIQGVWDTNEVCYAPINSNGTLGTWVSTSGMTITRRDFQVVTYNGYIYAIGGSEQSGVPLSSNEYAPINSNGTLGTWVSTSSMNIARRSHAAAIYNGYIYAVGGGTYSSTEYVPINSNGTLGTWVSTSSMNIARSALGVVVYNGYIYAIGGLGPSSVYLASTEYAPINSNGTLGTWVSTSSMVNQRIHLSMVVYNGYIYAIGGASTVFGILSSTEYAPINSNGTLGAWLLASQLISPRYLHGSTINNGYIYSVGGNDGFSDLASTEYAPIANNLGTLGSWASTTSMGVARGGLSTVSYNGYIYAIGGNTSGPALASVEFAPINANGTIGSWSTTSSLITPRQDHASFVYNGHIYVIGGHNGGMPYSSTEYAIIYADGTLSSWFSTSSMLSGRNSFGTGVYNGYVYVLGGVDGGPSVLVERASINSNGTLGSWQSTTSLPSARIKNSVAVYNGYIYSIGGYDGSGNGKLSVFYAPINSSGAIGSWVTTASTLYERYYSQAVAYNGYLYVIGSEGAAGSSVEFSPINLNGSLSGWQFLNSLGSRKYGHGSVVYNGYLYRIGGYNGGVAHATTEYAPINGVAGLLGTWNATTSMTTVRGYPGTIAYNGYIYAIGGTSDGSTNLSSTEYAPINSNGTLGAWVATVSMKVARANMGVAVYNGYIYVIGGQTLSGVILDTTEYAPINSNGTLGTWDNSSNTTTARYYTMGGIIAYNGYIYAIGGATTGSTPIATTEYAPINSNGTLGTWTATTSMMIARKAPGCVVYNGYIYAIGGISTGSTLVASTEYAPINSNGSLGTWTATASLVVPRGYLGSIVYNGYIYVIGGQTFSGGVLASTEYAPINADGTLGSWIMTTGMISRRQVAGRAIYNGYIYAIGGANGVTFLSSTEYVPILHTPQSRIQQLWHKTYDKGSNNNSPVYVSLKYNNQFDNDTMIRYRLWNGSGTTTNFRSQWVPLDSYKMGLAEKKIILPTYNLPFRYFDFEIMRSSGDKKVSNNIISIGYGSFSGSNNCLACYGTDVVISDHCIVNTELVCHLNNVEITGSGILEVRPPGNLNFDTIGHNFLIRNGGRILVKNDSKIYYERIYTYSWSTGSWGVCSSSCGGGSQSRTVTCMRDDNVVVNDSFCTDTMPALTQPCNTQVCPTNGACNTSTNFACTAGVSINNVAGSCGGNATWTCEGLNGGTDASCSKANGACPECSSTAWQCTVGVASSFRDYGCGSTKTWKCTNAGSRINCSASNPACPPPPPPPRVCYSACSYSVDYTNCSNGGSSIPDKLGYPISTGYFMTPRNWDNGDVCNNGSWSAATQQCWATDCEVCDNGYSWSQNGNTCNGAFGANYPDGQSSEIYDSDSSDGTTGSASFTCNNGSIVITSQSCNSN